MVDMRSDWSLLSGHPQDERNEKGGKRGGRRYSEEKHGKYSDESGQKNTPLVPNYWF